MSINVALDGPSGAGKSTIAKMAAKKLKFVYVDTGAMYRTIAYYAMSKKADLENADSVCTLLGEIDIKLVYDEGVQKVLLNGEDVSDKIRTPEVSMGASKVSAIPEVREFLLSLQRNIASENNIIMDGRDIGTVILPKADVKIFLTASAEERAKRRYKELAEKGDKSTYEEVLKDINQRDFNDIHRDVAPLKKAEDAIEVDSTSLTLEQTVDEIFRIISEKCGKKKPKPPAMIRNLPKTEPIPRGIKLSRPRMFGYKIVGVLARFFLNIYFKFSYEGKENIPQDGSNIFASNHRSYLDPVLVALYTPVPCTYMAKEELFHQNIFFTWLIKTMGAFPVQRGKGDAEVFDVAFGKLKEGRNLVIFPEGTRSKDGKVGKGKTGVALIAALAQVPVIPVGISFKGKLKFRSHITVRFGKPIPPEDIKMESGDPRELRTVKTRIMNEIKELVDQ
ncbi:MAG: (d)CMP kinase [Oscillospiraceae bacterium]